jgi:hypothetical protein
MHALRCETNSIENRYGRGLDTIYIEQNDKGRKSYRVSALVSILLETHDLIMAPHAEGLCYRSRGHSPGVDALTHS